MAVTTGAANQPPTILLQQTNYFANLHSQTVASRRREPDTGLLPASSFLADAFRASAHIGYAIRHRTTPKSNDPANRSSALCARQRINGGMLRDGLIDEVSLLLAPLADGALGTPSLFDVEGADGHHRARKLNLLGVEQRTGGVLWLRYEVV